MATLRGLGVLVILAVLMVAATAALLEIPRLFRDPTIIDKRGPSVDTCDPDYDRTCPTANPNQDHRGGEPPGDNPIFSYPPVPMASASAAP
jgi:hypothetical protein